MMASRTFIRRSIGVVLIVVALIAQAMASFFAQELIADAAILAIFALSLDLLMHSCVAALGYLAQRCQLLSCLANLLDGLLALRLLRGKRK